MLSGGLQKELSTQFRRRGQQSPCLKDSFNILTTFLPSIHPTKATTREVLCRLSYNRIMSEPTPAEAATKAAMTGPVKPKTGELKPIEAPE